MLRDGGRRSNHVQGIPVSVHPHEAGEEVEALRRKYLALREGSPIESKSRSDVKASLSLSARGASESGRGASESARSSKLKEGSGGLAI